MAASSLLLMMTLSFVCVMAHASGQGHLFTVVSSGGHRQSSFRRLIEIIAPQHFHGSVQFGSGYIPHVETDIGFNPDAAHKWWLGENVCVTTSETDEVPTTPRTTSDSVDDVGSDERHVVRVGSNRRGSQRSGQHEYRWSWSSDGRQVEERVSDRGRVTFYSHTCEDITSPTSQYRCNTVNQLNGGTAKVTTTVYECCPGYSRIPGSSDGCNNETRSSLITSLETSGAVEMTRVLNVTGLAEVLHQNGDQGTSRPYTVFAPSDAAFNNYTLPFNDVNDAVVRVSEERYTEIFNQLNDIMANLIVQGHFASADFVNDMLLASALEPEGRHLRINKFYNWLANKPLLTANCVPLVTADLRAANGIIHVVERVIPSAVDTIEELTSRHPQLTVFSSLVERLMLNNVGEHYTVFAPSDSAFRRLDASLLDRLMDSSDQCAINLLRQHVLPKVVCSAALRVAGRRVSLVNVDRRFINVSIVDGTAHEALYVGGEHLVETDLMATNGVVHIVDGVMFTELVSSMLQLAQSPSLNTSKFVELIDSSGLRERIDSLNGNFTVFLPTNSAIQEIAAEIANMSTSEVGRFVEYHVVPRALTSSALYDDRTLKTMDDESSLLINEYHSFPFSHRSRKTVQCIPITRIDINANGVCNGGIGHVISGVLRRPVSSLVDLLAGESQFSRLVELFHTARLTSLLQDHSSSVTVLAPSNAAFDALPAAALRKLTSDVNVAQRVLRSHIIPDIMCCSGVFPPQLLQLPVHELNLDGWLMEVDRDRRVSRQHTVIVDRTHVRRCDMMAANGVVHVVDRFLPSAIQRYVRSASGGRTRSSGSVFESIQEAIEELIG